MRNIKWGVLGTAGIAHGQTIPGMKLAGNCELYAIAGRDINKAEDFGREFGFEKVYGDYEELLHDPAVEAVYIPLPNTLHVDWTKKALCAGKHVLCEKPLAPTAREALELFNTAARNGVLLMEAFAYLHSPLITALKSELDSGIIGDVRYIETAFITSDYDISNIRMRRETCGGSVYDLGCYCTSLILRLLGREPERVQAVADFFPKERVDRFTSALLSFGDDCRAAFDCGMVLATNLDRRIDRLQVHGTKGCLRTSAEFNGCGELGYSVTVGESTTYKTVSVRQNYALEVEQFGRCIANGEARLVSPDFTVANLRTVERVLAAIGY